MILKLGTGLVTGIFLSVCMVLDASGQQAMVHVTDQKNHDPVAFAHVCFQGLKSGVTKYRVTSVEGKVTNESSEISKLIITCVGYSTLTDTISPGQTLEIQLKPTVLNMNEVVVTAQYTPEKADKSIYRVNVINSRQIEQKAAINMADLLKNEVNMRVSQDGVLGTSLSLQGLSGEHVKFLIDGVPLIGRMNGNIDLNTTSLYNIDHVEVIEGPMSVVYGSNAMAGVINIITRENKVSRLSVNADTYAESVGTYNVDAGFSMNQKKHVFSLDAARNFFGGWSENPHDRHKVFKPRRQVNASTYYIFTSQGYKLKAVAEYFNELLVDKDSLMKPYFETAFDAYFTTLRYSGRMESSKSFRDNRYLNLIASYSGYERAKKTYFKNLTTLDQVLAKDPELQDTTKIGNWLFRGTFAREDLKKKLNYQAGFDFNIESGSGKRILNRNQEIGDYAVFMTMKYAPATVISLQPGVRFIYNTKYSAPVVYAMSGKWMPDEHLAVQASWSKGFRSPALKELYLFFKDVNHDIQGNPDLKAEYSNNFNLGVNYAVEQKKRAWSLELNGFYNLINNIIDLAQGAGTLYTYINVEKYKTRGLQMDLSYAVYPALSLKAGIAETGRYNSIAAGENNVEKFTYTTDVTSDVTYRFAKKNLTFALYYRYTGRTPQFNIINNQVVQGSVSSYHTIDLTMTKGFFKENMRLSAGVKNLFDNTTIPAAGSTGGAHGGGNDGSLAIGYGRTWFAKLSWTFNHYR